MIEEYQCHICKCKEEANKSFRSIEKSIYRSKEIYIIKELRKVCDYFSNYSYHTMKGIHILCDRKYCDNMVFTCDKCFTANRGYNNTIRRYHPFEYGICKICEDLKRDGKKIINKELDKISSNGYNTFRDIKGIITDYLDI